MGRAYRASDAPATAADLAAEFAISPGAIYRTALAIGIDGIMSPGRVYTAAEAAAIRAARRAQAARVSTTALALALGVSIATIRKHARRLGLVPANGYAADEAARIRESVAASPWLSRRRNGQP